LAAGGPASGWLFWRALLDTGQARLNLVEVLAEMLFCALGAKTVGEVGFGMFGDIGFDAPPVLVLGQDLFGQDLLAESADRKQAMENADFTNLASDAVDVKVVELSKGVLARSVGLGINFDQPKPTRIWPALQRRTSTSQSGNGTIAHIPGSKGMAERLSC
jgi:hypothetical protein